MSIGLEPPGRRGTRLVGCWCLQRALLGERRFQDRRKLVESERLVAQRLQMPNDKRGDPMTETQTSRAHLIAGGFPPGSYAGHDHDYARLRLLGLLAEREVPASVANDFADIEKWLPISQLLITYVAGPYPDAAQCRVLQGWLEGGGRWLGL